MTANRFVVISPPLPHSLSALSTAAATGNLLDLEDPAKSALTSSMKPPHLDNNMFGPSSSVNNNVVWVSVCRGHRDICRASGCVATSISCVPDPITGLFLG